jgi:RNA polymerase sigma factor (sigma-70 family)
LWPSATERINLMSTAPSQVEKERVTFNQVYSDGFVRSLVRKKSLAVVRRYHFMRSDRDDIEQELWLRLFKALRGFDSQFGNLRTFLVAVVERATAEIVRTRCAWKRGERFASLDSLVACRGTPHELAVADEAMREFELHEAVEAALERLPETLRNLTTRLVGESIVDVARATGVERTTIHRRIRELQERFREMGLHEFL